MFDLTSTKLLLLGIVALLVVGPKDLPVLLRTIGKYVGMVRRQAGEFRAQFDEAIRESELAELRKDVESLGREATDNIRDVESEFDREMAAAEREMNAATESKSKQAALEKAAAGEAEPRDETTSAASGDETALMKPAEPVAVGDTDATGNGAEDAAQTQLAKADAGASDAKSGA